MSLSPEQQLALSDQALRHDWSQEQLDAAAAEVELTTQGQQEMAHLETEQVAHDQELEKGLGIRALSPADQLTVADFATQNPGLDQDEIDKITERMVSSK